MHNPAFAGLRWEDIGVVACAMVLMLLAHAGTSWFFRRKHKLADKTAGPAAVHHQFLDAVASPLVLLIWTCGIYLSATLLVMKLTAGSAADAAATVLDKLCDVALFGALCWMFYRLTGVLETWLIAWAAKSKSKIDDLIAPLIGRSLRVILPVIGIIFGLPVIGLPPEWSSVAAKASSIMIIGAITWILLQAVNTGENALLARYDIKAADNLQARKIYTQAHVIGKMCIYVAILVFSACLFAHALRGSPTARDDHSRIRGRRWNCHRLRRAAYAGQSFRRDTGCAHTTHSDGRRACG